MKTEETELLERTIANPLTQKAARQVAQEMLDEQGNKYAVGFDPAIPGSETVICYHRNPGPDFKDADTKALNTFRAIVNTAAKFELEKIPFTLSIETARQLLSLAECGYLDRHAGGKR